MICNSQKLIINKISNNKDNYNQGWQNLFIQKKNAESEPESAKLADSDSDIFDLSDYGY